MSTDANAELQTAIQELSSSYSADIVFFAGPLRYPSERRLNDIIRKHKTQENVVLLLNTRGGSADVGYQIVRCLQRCYKDFVLFVDSICKSAGTLVALGANKIIMSDTAEMGPLDVQIQKPGELDEYISGLTSMQALDTLRTELFGTFEGCFLKLRFRSGRQISTKMATEVATRLAVGVFRPVYAQFDPLRLADDMRANLIAHEYGRRIITSNVKDDTIEKLIGDYPSHGFVIDREEAKTLFELVCAPNDAASKIADTLRPIAEKALDGDEPIIKLFSQNIPKTGDTDENGTRETGEVSQTSSPNHRSASEQTQQDQIADSANEQDRSQAERTELRENPTNDGPMTTDCDEMEDADDAPSSPPS